MTEETQFDRFIQEALTQETKPVPWKVHPGLSMMLDGLCGELDPSKRSEFSAHIATCEKCNARWKSLREFLQTEQQALNKQTTVRDLRSLVLSRQPQERTAVLGQLRSLWEGAVRKPAVIAFAASAVTIGIFFAGAVPVLRAPMLATSDRLNDLTKEVLQLRGEMSSSNSGITTIINSLIESDQLTPTIISQYDWEVVEEYEVQSEATWQGVSEAMLGRANLWPLIWYMNRAAALPDEPLIPGQVIRLPTFVQ